jgi:hypothetical protein
VKFHTARGGEAFHPHIPLFITLALDAFNSEQSLVGALDQETATDRTILAAVEVRRTAFTETGEVRVNARYICPDQYKVELALASFAQGTSPNAYRLKMFARRVTCDGSRNHVAVKFEKSSAGEPFRSDVESVIQMRLVATDPEQGDFVEADHGETLIIRP